MEPTPCSDATFHTCLPDHLLILNQPLRSDPFTSLPKCSPSAGGPQRPWECFSHDSKSFWMKKGT